MASAWSFTTPPGATAVIQPLAALLALLALAAAQDPVQAPQLPATPVEDVEVVARAREDLARVYVNRVAAPARGRGLGRWRKICPGIANLDRAVAQPIADRLAARAG